MFIAVRNFWYNSPVLPRRRELYLLLPCACSFQRRSAAVLGKAMAWVWGVRGSMLQQFLRVLKAASVKKKMLSFKSRVFPQWTSATESLVERSSFLKTHFRWENQLGCDWFTRKYILAVYFNGMDVDMFLCCFVAWISSAKGGNIFFVIKSMSIFPLYS